MKPTKIRRFVENAVAWGLPVCVERWNDSDVVGAPSLDPHGGDTWRFLVDDQQVYYAEVRWVGFDLES